MSVGGAALNNSNELSAWQSVELFQLLHFFFHSSLAILPFCDEIDNFIRQSHRHELNLNTLLFLPYVSAESSINGSNRTLGQELHSFRRSSSITAFGDSFLSSFGEIHNAHKQLLAKLEQKETELRRSHLLCQLSLLLLQIYLSLLILGAAVGFLITIAVSPIVLALVVLSNALLNLIAYIIVKSLWSQLLQEMSAWRQAIIGARIYAGVAVEELCSIRSMVARIQYQMSLLLLDVEFANRHQDSTALRLAMIEIAKTRQEFVVDLNHLNQYMNDCKTHITSTIAQAMRRISRCQDYPYCYFPFP